MKLWVRAASHEDIDQLPTREVDRLLPSGREAVLFERVMAMAAVVSLAITGVTLILDWPQIWHRTVAITVGLIIVGAVGGQIKMNRFRRLINKAVADNKQRSRFPR